MNAYTDRTENLARVVTAFADTGRWNVGEGYSSPGQTFNEYMTWALYSLYARDHLEPAPLELVRETLVDTMLRRGFVRFREFEAELFRLYAERRQGQIAADLYPALLDWALRRR